MNEPSPYWFLVVLGAVALVFPLVPLGLAWLWARLMSPPKPSAEKNAVYECGLESKGDSWVQMKVHYYLYAIVFLIVDVEAVFLIPFAAAYASLSAGAVIAMLLFVLLVAEGLVWAWGRGFLEWK